MTRRPAQYRVTAARDGLHIEILNEKDFWDNSVLDQAGTTVLDRHIASVCQEIRQVLYYLGTADLTPH